MSTLHQVPIVLDKDGNGSAYVVHDGAHITVMSRVDRPEAGMQYLMVWRSERGARFRSYDAVADVPKAETASVLVELLAQVGAFVREP